MRYCFDAATAFATNARTRKIVFLVVILRGKFELFGS
jgi:hypothetical protein